MIEDIERLRGQIQKVSSTIAYNYWAKQHQAAIKEWRVHNALKAVIK